jgi:hypothetical protein
VVGTAERIESAFNLAIKEVRQMGIRPHLTTIIGVDNLQVDNNGKITDVRAKKFANLYRTQQFDDLFWKEIPHYTIEEIKDLECMDFEQREKPRKLCYHDVFVYQPDFGFPNVIGVIPPNHYNRSHLSGSWTVLYVLADAFGMPKDKPGYEVIQPVSDDEYKWMSLRHGQKLRQQYNHFAYGWLDADFILSQRILADLGLEFKVEELNLILYWYWC